MLSLRKYIVLALLPVLAACEKELEYDVESPQAALVVNCIFAEDSLWQVEVSTTARPGNGEQIQLLKDAQISIYENNVRLNDFVLDSMDARPLSQGEDVGGRTGSVKFFFHRTINSRGRAGRDYEIRVSHPQYPVVYGTSVIPRAPRARLLSNTTSSAILIKGVSHTHLPFKISDEGGNNYYGLEVWVRHNATDPQMSRLGFYSSNPILEENFVSVEGNSQLFQYFPASSGVFFSNLNFGSQEQGLDIMIPTSVFNSAAELYVRVLHLSPQLYEFATSYQRQLLNQSNPFAEPAQVYSNIQNGIGIFAGYSLAELQVR
jgi:hypothetical protein